MSMPLAAHRNRSKKTVASGEPDSSAYPFHMRRLKKFEIEELLATYDADPIASLTIAVGLIFNVDFDSWEQAVAALPFSNQRKQDLMMGTTQALDQLLKQLVEERTL